VRDYGIEPEVQKEFARGEPPPPTSLIKKWPTIGIKGAKFKLLVLSDLIVIYKQTRDFDAQICGLHGNLRYAAFGGAWPFLLSLFAPFDSIALLGPSEVSPDVNDIGLRDVVLYFSAIGGGRRDFYAGADGADRGRW
jgi:hypothetical protein